MSYRLKRGRSDSISVGQPPRLDYVIQKKILYLNPLFCLCLKIIIIVIIIIIIIIIIFIKYV